MSFNIFIFCLFLVPTKKFTPGKSTPKTPEQWVYLFFFFLIVISSSLTFIASCVVRADLLCLGWLELTILESVNWSSKAWGICATRVVNMGRGVFGQPARGRGPDGVDLFTYRYCHKHRFPRRSNSAVYWHSWKWTPHEAARYSGN